MPMRLIDVGLKSSDWITFNEGDILCFHGPHSAADCYGGSVALVLVGLTRVKVSEGTDREITSLTLPQVLQ